MSALTLPPGTRLASVPNGRPAAMPQSVPDDLLPAAVADTSAEAHAGIELAAAALRKLSGLEQWEPAAPTRERVEPPQTAPLGERADTDNVPEPAHLEIVDGNAHYAYFQVVPGGRIATTADGRPLTLVSDDGQPVLDNTGEPEPVWVDEDGYETLPPELNGDEEKSSRRSRLASLLGSGGRTNQDEQPTADYYDENGVKITDLQMPPPGAPLQPSNHRRGKRIFQAALAGCGVVAAGSLMVGVLLGTTRVPAQGVISTSEAETYRLHSFPVEATAAFGARYLTSCLTHGDRDQLEEREATLTAMAAANVARNCGWQSGGAVQEPTSIVFNGNVDPVPGFEIGDAAFLGFDVMMDGANYAMNVPVWAGPTEGGGMSMQVIGDLGIAPAAPAGAAPLPTMRRNTDQQLGGTLNGQVIEPFLVAWGASDSRQLGLLTARDPHTTVRHGLDGALTDPEVRAVVAYTTKSSPGGEPITYEDGDEVTADVAVTWTVTGSESTQQAGYRMTLMRQADRWLVAEIQPGLVDSTGAVGGGRAASSDTTGSSSSRGSSLTPTSSSSAPSAGLGGVDDLRSGNESDRPDP